MNKEVLLLDNSADNLIWFQQNLKKLLLEYEGHFIAIKDQKIVASANNVDFLIKKLDSEGIDSSEVLIEYLPPKNVIVIL